VSPGAPGKTWKNEWQFPAMLVLIARCVWEIQSQVARYGALYQRGLSHYTYPYIYIPKPSE